MKKTMDKVEARGIPKEIEEKVEKRNQTTELVFILDKSGSMAGMEKDTIGGFNAMIEKQKAIEGKVFVSTVLFSNDSEVLHERKSLFMRSLLSAWARVWCSWWTAAPRTA